MGVALIAAGMGIAALAEAGTAIVAVYVFLGPAEGRRLDHDSLLGSITVIVFAAVLTLLAWSVLWIGWRKLPSTRR
jgi:hypothetical protein